MESGRRLTVLYDADCGLCSMSARVLHALDHGRRLRLQPLQAYVPRGSDDPDRAALAATLHVRDPAGRWHTGGDAVLRTMAAVPVLLPLAVAGHLPGVRRIVDRLYVRVAAHRDAIGAWLGVDRCRVDPEALGD